MRLAQAARRMLEDRLIPFWAGLRDDDNGGFYGYMDFDLNLDRRAVKGCILNSRILWFFSEAAMATGSLVARGCADHAWRFLRDRCLDREHGGLYWSVAFDGAPEDTAKHTYNQAFGIYALASYYRLTGDREALGEARALFELIEGRCTDEQGYLESFARDWRPEDNDKLSENGVLAERTMNTLLHVFEGYSGLYLAAPDDRVRAALLRLLDIYEKRVFDPERNRQRVFFDRDYRELIDLHSYGHDIESSWLIDWGAALLGDPALSARIGRINGLLAENIYRTAYRNHSVANECEAGRVDQTRVWWVQAEAVLGFVNASRKTGEARYLEAARDIWRYIGDTLVDPRPGSEWFWDVDEQGRPASRKPIVEPWKCPYHNGRMCMELMRRNPDVEV
ncbi:MAG: AGE family epimerase/isomerase [Clostridia bacterium]|nr:AGE family epimerase/isomerase [Clostridia bacterium]